MADKYNSTFAKLMGWINGAKTGFAVTVGQTTYYSVDQNLVGIRWRAHEERHKKQFAEKGTIVFLCTYFWYLITKGYKNNPYEVDARLHENDQ
jgi:type II secretory pathway component PulM